MTADSADGIAWAIDGAPAPSIVFFAQGETALTRGLSVTAGAGTFTFVGVDLYSSMTAILSGQKLTGTLGLAVAFLIHILATMPSYS